MVLKYWGVKHMWIRKFKINTSTLAKIENMNDYIGINENTIASMAVYHGIQNMISGLRPVYIKKKVKEENKEEIKIRLPWEIWKMIEQYRYELKMPLAELIETLLDIELKKYEGMIKEMQLYRESHLSMDMEKIAIYIKVPKLIYENIIEKEKALNLKHSQLVKYMLLNGIIEEEVNGACGTMPFNADLIGEIEMLNLNLLKAITFSAFLLKYKCWNGNYKD